MEDFVIASGEAALLLGGILILLCLVLIASRILRAWKHGFSIRLQLFLAIWGTTLLTTGLIGVWAVDRVEAMGHERDAFVDLVRGFGPKSAFLFCLLFAVAVVSSVMLGRSLARPIERLAQSAEAISEGKRQAALPAPVGREVRRLTEAFESMRRSLEDRHQFEQFVADLSHELKNPVSAIRASVEVLQEGAAEEPVMRERFLQRVDEASRKLEVLLQDLLALARLEARGIDPKAGLLMLDELAHEAVLSFLDLAEQKSVSIEERFCAIRMRGDGQWLRRAIDNLLSNALRYSPSGGKILCTLEVEREMAVFRISDEGPGVLPTLRERLFERFVSDRRDREGTGLGLAIVRTVAENHGGQARLVESERGACFEMKLRI